MCFGYYVASYLCENTIVEQYYKTSESNLIKESLIHALSYLIVETIVNLFVRSWFSYGNRGDQLVCYVALLGALLWLWCVVLYFATAGYGECGTKFEVEYDVNPSSISVLLLIDGGDVAPGISLIVILVLSSSIWIILKELLQGTFRPPKRFQQKPMCVFKKSDSLVVRSVVLIAISMVGNALKSCGCTKVGRVT